MSARLTVVLDDEDLYRRLKVKAAEEGTSMKDLVEAGLRHVLGEAPAAEGELKRFDWGRYDSLLKEFRDEDEALGEDASYPSDLSDVKHYLYGHPKATAPRALRIAEEPSGYDAP